MKIKPLQSIHNFFFEEVDDFNFGISRLLFFGTNFIMYWFIYWNDTRLWLEVDRSFWAPVGVYKVFKEPLLLTSSAMGVVDILFPMALLFSALGLFSRFSFFLSFFTGFYVLGLSHNFGKIHHSTHLPMLMLFVFCLARYPGRLSLDHLLFKKWIKIPERSFEYKWPLSLSMTLIALTYTAAGFQKFRRFGFDWALGDNMEIILLSRTDLTDLARWVVEVPYLSQGLALSGLLIQLAGVLFLIVKPLRIGFILYPLFHIGTWQLLGANGNFNTYLPVFLLLVPWRKLLKGFLPKPQVIRPNG